MFSICNRFLFHFRDYFFAERNRAIVSNSKNTLFVRSRSYFTPYFGCHSTIGWSWCHRSPLHGGGRLVSWLVLSPKRLPLVTSWISLLLKLQPRNWGFLNFLLCSTVGFEKGAIRRPFRIARFGAPETKRFWLNTVFFAATRVLIPSSRMILKPLRFGWQRPKPKVCWMECAEIRFAPPTTGNGKGVLLFLGEIHFCDPGYFSSSNSFRVSRATAGETTQCFRLWTAPKHYTSTGLVSFVFFYFPNKHRLPLSSCLFFSVRSQFRMVSWFWDAFLFFANTKNFAWFFQTNYQQASSASAWGKVQGRVSLVYIYITPDFHISPQHACFSSRAHPLPPRRTPK